MVGLVVDIWISTGGSRKIPGDGTTNVGYLAVKAIGVSEKRV